MAARDARELACDSAAAEARGGRSLKQPDEVIDVEVVYIRPRPGGWSMEAGGEIRDFATASGAIFEGIQKGRALSRTGREVWVMWRNGEAWSVAWTSDGLAKPAQPGSTT